MLENAGTDLQSLGSPCSTTVSGTTSSDLSTLYEYDEAGNLTDMTDASGEDQSYTYDRLGRMTSRTDGLGETVTWAYDERGNRLTGSDRERAPAISVTWAYDTADRMTSRTADSATVDCTYDAIGGLISADGPSGETKMRTEMSQVQLQANSKWLHRFGVRLLPSTGPQESVRGQKA